MAAVIEHPKLEVSISHPSSIPVPSKKSRILSPLAHPISQTLPLSPPASEENQSHPVEPENTLTQQSRETDGDEGSYLSARISPTYVDSKIPPSIRSHVVPSPLPSRSPSMSSPELLVPGPARTPILAQEFEHASSVVYSHTGHSLYSGIFSPRSLRTISSHDVQSSRMSSPPSAVALSSTQLHPPLQLHVLRQNSMISPSSITVVPETLYSRPRHALYYIAEEMVTLEAEGCLYRVHKWLLEKDSEYFRSLFQKFTIDGAMGKSDLTPIPLVDVNLTPRDEIEGLTTPITQSVYEPDTIDLREWIRLLAVSTRLQFPKVRRWAFREITQQFASLDPVEVVVLAVKYDVPQWLAPAYASPCRRREPLSDEQAEKLGPKITARVGRAREAIREELFNAFLCKQYGRRWVPEEHEADDSLVARVVQRVFWPDTF